MDTDPFRYQQFISDIAGQDIEPHSGSSDLVIRNVRNWLSTESGDNYIPGGPYIINQYAGFQAALPFLCESQRLEVEELTFGNYTHFCRIWLEETA